MKHVLISLAVVCGVLVLTAAGLFASLFLSLQGIPEDFRMNGVSLVADGFVSVGIVDLGNGTVALVDAGNDSEAVAVLAELSAMGFGPEAVTAIFLTHGHADHIAAASKFPDAEVMALPAEADLVAGRVAPDGILGRLMPANLTGIEVTRPLADLETVQLDETGVRVYAMPGHTRGSAAYLVNGVLFLGDEANATTDGALRTPQWLFTADMDEAVASLIRLDRQLQEENAEVDAIVFAHSGVLVDARRPLTAFASEIR